LYSVAAALSEAVSSQDVARVTVDQGIAAVGASAGSLALLTEDGQHLEMVGSIGFAPDVMNRWQRFRLDAQIPLAEAVRRGEPIYIENSLDRLARYPELATVTAVSQTLSSACIPLIIGNRTVGSLGLSFDTPDAFSTDDRQFMISLARQCAQALERARLFEQEQLARAQAERAETQTRELAKRFERQSRLFERIASTTPDFIYIFDLTGRFIYANRRLLEVWGTTYEQAIGKNLYELGYPQWHADMHMRELRQVIENKQPIKGEVPFTGGSGISGVYEYIFTPVFDADGNVEVISGTTRDVTERRAFEQRLTRDAMLLANVQDSVIVTDLDGIVRFWNQGATQLFGWTAEEMLNRPYADRFPESERERVEAWVQRIATSPEGSPESLGEWYDYRKDGSRVWIEGSTRHITSSENESLGIMGVCRDITERKEAEAERETLLANERAARAEAERAGRMKDEFLATLSHELRTPLNAILGWSTILTGRTPDPADLEEGLDVIQRNARVQTQIIEDLLDMSRIISGKVRLEVQRIDLAPVLSAAVDTVKPAADAKGVRIHSVMDPKAGPVSGDPARLQQVFWNLLSNAVKFTPRGGQVQVLLERINSHLEITVTDTGEGIPAEFLPHAFDRFRQADSTTTRRHGGLGLGLAIVKQLVELHGGTVQAKSPGAGQGSTFCVALPMTIIHADPHAEKAERRHPTSPAQHSDYETGCLQLSGVRIIAIDDEPDARSLLKRLLEDCQASVRVAASASDAMALINDEIPDVIISDIGMPGEDGYSLIRRIRELPVNKGGSTPAIALTAYARSEDRMRAIRAGFQAHVVKPINPAELITIAASLAKRPSN
jgi:PAS domain S-box-containing protein